MEKGEGKYAGRYRKKYKGEEEGEKGFNTFSRARKLSGSGRLAGGRHHPRSRNPEGRREGGGRAVCCEGKRDETRKKVSSQNLTTISDVVFDTNKHKFNMQKMNKS